MLKARFEELHQVWLKNATQSRFFLAEYDRLLFFALPMLFEQASDAQICPQSVFLIFVYVFGRMQESKTLKTESRAFSLFATESKKRTQEFLKIASQFREKLMRPAGHFTIRFAVRVRSLNLRFLKLLASYTLSRVTTGLAVFVRQTCHTKCHTL